jgi:hypothetical protein
MFQLLRVLLKNDQFEKSKKKVYIGVKSEHEISKSSLFSQLNINIYHSQIDYDFACFAQSKITFAITTIDSFLL